MVFLSTFTFNTLFIFVLRNYENFLHSFRHTFPEKHDRVNLYPNFSRFLVKTGGLLLGLMKIKTIIRYSKHCDYFEYEVGET
jgi:hypothetical protein